MAFRIKLTGIEEAHQVAVLKTFLVRQQTYKTNRVGVRSMNPCGEILLFDKNDTYTFHYEREKAKRRCQAN